MMRPNRKKLGLTSNHFVPNKMAIKLDVFGTFITYGVVGNMHGSLIVTKQQSRR